MKFFAIRRKSDGVYLRLGRIRPEETNTEETFPCLYPQTSTSDTSPWMIRRKAYAELVLAGVPWWEASFEAPTVTPGTDLSDLEIVELVIMDPGAPITFEVKERSGPWIDVVRARIFDNDRFINGEEGYQEVPNVGKMNSTLYVMLKFLDTAASFMNAIISEPTIDKGIKDRAQFYLDVLKTEVTE